MNTTTRTSTAERLGRTLGRGWRAYVRGERRASNWLVSKGVPVAGATVLLWLVKLVVLGVLLYSAFWLALLVAFSVVAAWAARGSAYDEYEEGEIGDQADHKRSVFYDPINYNDDPDPRFDDER